MYYALFDREFEQIYQKGQSEISNALLQDASHYDIGKSNKLHN